MGRRHRVAGESLLPPARGRAGGAETTPRANAEAAGHVTVPSKDLPASLRMFITAWPVSGLLPLRI